MFLASVRGWPPVRVRTSQIAAVLEGLTYPAAKWQIVAEADYFGTNGPIRALLWAIPAGQYESFEDISIAIAAVHERWRFATALSPIVTTTPVTPPKDPAP